MAEVSHLPPIADTSSWPSEWSQQPSKSVHLIYHNDIVLAVMESLEQAQKSLEFLATKFEQTIDSKKCKIFRTCEPESISISTQSQGTLYNGSLKLRCRYQIHTVPLVSLDSVVTHLISIPDVQGINQ